MLVLLPHGSDVLLEGVDVGQRLLGQVELEDLDSQFEFLVVVEGHARELVFFYPSLQLVQVLGVQGRLTGELIEGRLHPEAHIGPVFF